MLSNILDRISFWSLFVVIVLLPVFFLPFTKIPVDISKGLLLVIGLTVSIIFWMAARFSDGKIVLPRSWVLVSGLGILLAFLLSSLFSPALNVSFFGVMLDAGTFWFMFLAFLLMVMSSLVLRDSKNAKTVFWGVIVSSAVLLVFQSLRFIMPQTLSLGILGDSTDNILGSFNSLGIFAGFTALMSLFVLEFFQNKKLMKWFLGAILVLSIFLAIVVNFPTVWCILGVFTLLIFVYKVSLSSNKHNSEGEKRSFPIISFAVIMVSLLFFMSGSFVSDLLPSRLRVSNLEIRPSFSATLTVAGSVFKKDPILGAGPNRFSNVWSMYKPAVINSTPFWDTSFNSGMGTIPTFMVTTGSLGILSWVIFLVFLFISGMKVLFISRNKEDMNIETIFFLAAFYFFISSIFYSTGIVLFLLAFAFTGAFIGFSTLNHPKGSIVISFLDDPRKSFFSILLILLAMVACASASFKYMERFTSIMYFQKTFSAKTVLEAQSNINKALSLYQNDLYFRTYSQTYIAQINTLAAKGQSITEAEKTELKSAYEQAVSGAQLAISYDKTNYLNYSALGAVYETVAPLGVTDAYDQALSTYKTVSDLNPLNPGLKFVLSRVSFAKGDMKAAKDYAIEALNLKQNYVDPLIVLSQIAKNEGNNKDALAFAEAAFSISPQDKNLEQYVNYLKNSSPLSPSSDTTKKSGSN